MRCFLRGLLAALIVAVLAVALLFFLAPSEVRVERSIVIDAPPERIFPKVNRLEAWKSWSPWMQREPDMKSSYEGPESGVGAKTSWDSETQGAGSQTITESVPNERIDTALDFGEMGSATSDWTFAEEEDGSGTRVTWGMDVGPVDSPIARFFNLLMDRMVGTDYETGLANLKVEIESESAN